MAIPTGRQYSVGLRNVWVFELDENGLPRVPTAGSATPYEGYQVVGGKGMELTIPDPRRITHSGDDRVLAVDFLPTMEPITASLQTARNDYDVYAVLSGTRVQTIGEAKAIGIGTDKQGYEPQVGFLAWQQSLDEVGRRNYRTFVVPKTIVVAKPGGMGENATVHTFALQPTPTQHNLWGSAFGDGAGSEGFREAYMRELQSERRLKLVAWRQLATSPGFSTLRLPAGEFNQPFSSAKISLWTNGSSTAFSYTPGNPGTITLTSGSPPVNSVIVSLYEV